MDIKKAWTTNHPAYKRGKNMKSIKGIVLHSVGCCQPDPLVFFKRLQTADDFVGWHYTVSNTQIYQFMPDKLLVGHCGGVYNNDHIGIEMTESALFEYYYNRPVIKDKNRSKVEEFSKDTYKLAVELCAFLCKEYSINPQEIVSHHECYLRGVGSNHGDPEHLWDLFGLSMDGFRSDVNDLLTKQAIYKVQVGAFTKELNAKVLAEQLKKDGYESFIVKEVK